MGFLTSSRSIYVLIIIIEVVSVGYFYHKPTPTIAPKRSKRFLPRFLPKPYTEPHSHNGCNITGVKSWGNGMETLLQPTIEANCTALRKGDEREVWTVKKRVQDPGRFLPKLYAAPRGHNGCNITSVKSWENGMVTLLQPMIEANCTALRTGDEREVMTVKKKIETWVNAESDGEFLKTLYNCSHIVEEYSNNFYVSPKEENFPLAYILVVHNNVRQVLRLLKVIYRPHNLYCIHPDAKEPNLVEQFLAISRCLVNIFVASKLEKVYYNHHSIMDAQLNCMQDLMRFDSSRWRYAINLCGTELPLKTNREIVHSLFKLNGSSAVQSHEVPQTDGRFVNKAVLSGGVVRQTQEKLGPVPYGIKIYKGNNYLAAVRPFVSFLLTHKISIALRKYLQDVIVPEEYFYATIYKLPDVLGGPPKDPSLKIVVATCVWITTQYASQHQQELCKGKIVHHLCVLSSGDLPTVYGMRVNAPTPTFLFFNKYSNDLDHVVMDCVEQWLVERNLLEYKHDCLI